MIASTPPPKNVTKHDLADVWTFAHNKELRFNAGKQLCRLFEVVRTGAITADDLPEGVVQMADVFFKDKTTNMVAREKAEKRVRCLVERAPPSEDEVTGLCAYVQDAVRSPAKDDAMGRLAWSAAPVLG